MNSLPLIENLNRPDEADRMYAAEDLGYANDPAGIVPLCERLKIEPSRPVREVIFSALQRIDHPEVISAVAALLHGDDVFICNQAVLLLAQRGPASFPQIESILLSGDDHARKLALDVLGRIQSAEGDALYRLALRDPNPNIVITAVEGVGANAVTGLKPEMERIFEQGPEPMLLTAVVETLSRVGDAGSLEIILGRFPDLSTTPGWLQYSLIKALGCLGGPEQAAGLIGLLSNRPTHLAQPVVDALLCLRARVQSPPWPVELQHALSAILDRDITVVLRCQILLLLWQQQPGPELKDRLAIEVQLVQDPELREAMRQKMMEASTS